MPSNSRDDRFSSQPHRQALGGSFIPALRFRSGSFLQWGHFPKVMQLAMGVARSKSSIIPEPTLRMGQALLRHRVCGVVVAFWWESLCCALSSLHTRPASLYTGVCISGTCKRRPWWWCNTRSRSSSSHFLHVLSSAALFDFSSYCHQLVASKSIPLLHLLHSLNITNNTSHYFCSLWASCGQFVLRAFARLILSRNLCPPSGSVPLFYQCLPRTHFCLMLPGGCFLGVLILCGMTSLPGP